MENKMTLAGWNRILKHADMLCDGLALDKIHVRKQEYQVYDGRKGVYLQVMDADGNIFKQYASGIDTEQMMIRNLDAAAARIRKEA